MDVAPDPVPSHASGVPVRSGIVGTGFMGWAHAASVEAAGGVVVGYVGSSPEKAEAAAARVPGAAAAPDVGALIDLGLDVLHVCTPNHLHLEQVRAAVAAGVAVICEKPLATSLAEAEAMAAAVHQAGIVATVPFVNRYAPLVRELRGRVAQAAVDGAGAPWLLHGGFLQDWLADPATTNWRVDPARGGASRVFGDIGVHWCDLVELVTGQRIVALSAQVANAFTRDGGPDANGTEDGVVVSFRTDAAMGSVVLSQASAGRGSRFWIALDGAEQSYDLDLADPDVAWVRRVGAEERIDRDVAHHPGVLPRPPGSSHGYLECFADFVADTYAALRGEASDVLPGIDDGLRAAVLTDAVVRSSTSDAAWVDV